MDVINLILYFSLSIWVLLGTVVFLVLAISIVQLLINRAVRFFNKAREENDALMKHFQAITDGIKELKLHSQRREDFLDADLQVTASNLREYRIGSQRAIALSSGLGDLLFFLLLLLLHYITLQVMIHYYTICDTNLFINTDIRL